jgi:hypothetical protein
LFDGSSKGREGFRKLAVHPATITQYIFENLVEQDQPFILCGGSGGAVQIAYILSFYGIDAITDIAVIKSGFWMGRLDIGCFDNNAMNSHLHYSEKARAAIDLSLGFYTKGEGPCAMRDSSFYEIYKNSSVSIGGNYYYPTTQVFLLYGGNDQVGALNQGLTYYEQIVFANSPFVQMQIVEGSKHSMTDSLAQEVIKRAIFAETDIKRLNLNSLQ